jgi:hypothetical protein
MKVYSYNCIINKAVIDLHRNDVELLESDHKIEYNFQLMMIYNNWTKN